MAHSWRGPAPNPTSLTRSRQARSMPTAPVRRLPVSTQEPSRRPPASAMTPTAPSAPTASRPTPAVNQWHHESSNAGFTTKRFLRAAMNSQRLQAGRNTVPIAQLTARPFGAVKVRSCVLSRSQPLGYPMIPRHAVKPLRLFGGSRSTLSCESFANRGGQECEDAQSRVWAAGRSTSDGS